MLQNSPLRRHAEYAIICGVNESWHLSRALVRDTHGRGYFPAKFFMKTTARELSVFVDESGSFDSPLDPSRFNVITCLFHDQSADLSGQIADLENQLGLLGNPGVCIHAGPLVRREAEFLSLPLEDRRKLLGKILSFALHVPVHYHTFCIDKRYATTPEVISKNLTAQLTDYLSSSQDWLGEYTRLKVYYDNGQMRVSAILNEAFKTLPTVFVPCVKPERYRLFQVADLICTIELLKLKIKANIPLTKSELLFFRNHGILKRTYIRPLSRLMR